MSCWEKTLFNNTVSASPLQPVIRCLIKHILLINELHVWHPQRNASHTVRPLAMWPGLAAAVYRLCSSVRDKRCSTLQRSQGDVSELFLKDALNSLSALRGTWIPPPSSVTIIWMYVLSLQFKETYHFTYFNRASRFLTVLLCHFDPERIYFWTLTALD